LTGAAKRGMTLSSFIVEIAEREIAVPDADEFLARMRRITADTSDFDSAADIRRERESRLSQLMKRSPPSSSPKPKRPQPPKAI